MKKLLLSLSLAALSAFAQTAVFPGAIAGPSQLGKVANSIQTTLAASITSTTATTMTVTSSTNMVANSILTVDSERVWVCNIAGNVLTLGRSSCPNVDGRGVDNSTAATHAALARVYGYISAWTPNAAAAEITAIETALGTNLSNVADAGTIDQYNFAAQTPGGSLIIGNNTVTLSPVPLGVNGTDVGHYLYVSGGTGTAESCLISGGTAVAGSASGTVILTCANTHSGAWTVQSNSAGIQEALVATGVANIPKGSYSIYGTISPPANAMITGSGIVNSLLNQQFTDKPMISCRYDNLLVTNLSLYSPTPGIAGSRGLEIYGSNGNDPGTKLCNSPRFEGITLGGFYNAMYCDGAAGIPRFTAVGVNNNFSDAFLNYGCQGLWDDMHFINNNAGSAIVLRFCLTGGACGTQPIMNRIETFNNGGWGIDSTVGVLLSNSYLNNDQSGEIKMTNTPTAADRGFIVDSNLQYSGQPVGGVWVANATAPCFQGADLDGVVVQNVHFFGCNGNAITLTGTTGSTTLANNVIIGAGAGGTAGQQYGISLTGASSNHIIGNYSSNPVTALAGNDTVIANNIFSTNLALPTLKVTAGTRVAINSNVLTNSGGGDGLNIQAGVTVLPGNNVVNGTATRNGTLDVTTLGNVNYDCCNQTGADVASANTFVPSATNFVTTGVATLKTINAPSGMTNFCTAAGGAWTWDNTGNIASTPVVVTPGNVYCFHVMNTGNWYVQ